MDFFYDPSLKQVSVRLTKSRTYKSGHDFGRTSPGSTGWFSTAC